MKTIKSRKVLSETDIRTDSVLGNRKNINIGGTSRSFNTVLYALAIGGIVMTGATACSDEKSCSDYDVSRIADGNGSTAYDTGPNADPFDYGGDTDRSSSGDSVGNGDRCADSD